MEVARVIYYNHHEPSENCTTDHTSGLVCSALRTELSLRPGRPQRHTSMDFATWSVKANIKKNKSKYHHSYHQSFWFAAVRQDFHICHLRLLFPKHPFLLFRRVLGIEVASAPFPLQRILRGLRIDDLRQGFASGTAPWSYLTSKNVVSPNRKNTWFQKCLKKKMGKKKTYQNSSSLKNYKNLILQFWEPRSFYSWVWRASVGHWYKLRIQMPATIVPKVNHSRPGNNELNECLDPGSVLRWKLKGDRSAMKL